MRDSVVLSFDKHEHLYSWLTATIMGENSTELYRAVHKFVKKDELLTAMNRILAVDVENRNRVDYVIKELQKHAGAISAERKLRK